MPPTRDRRWVLAVPAAVLALGALTAWWIVTPDAFPGGVGNDTGVAEPGASEPYVLGAAPRPTAEVTLASARPRVDGPAAVRVAVCDRPIGVVEGSIEDHCDDALGVEGTRLGPDLDRWLVVEITPAEAETVVDGLSIAYTQGVRFGRQVVGHVLTVGPAGS